MNKIVLTFLIFSCLFLNGCVLVGIKLMTDIKEHKQEKNRNNVISSGYKLKLTEEGRLIYVSKHNSNYIDVK
jgi:hypothetical protein